MPKRKVYKIKIDILRLYYFTSFTANIGTGVKRFPNNTIHTPNKYYVRLLSISSLLNKKLGYIKITRPIMHTPKQIFYIYVNCSFK